MKDWRCLIGRHDWRVVEVAGREKYSECVRCGKHDWARHLNREVGPRYRGGGMPPGGDPGG